MKKGLLAVLLALAIVAPVFAAEKGSMEIDGKLGVLFSPTMSMDARGESMSGDFKTAFSLGADFFYYVEQQIALGFGLEYVVPSEEDETGGTFKYGMTNLFVQAKYDIAIENDIFNNIYPIVQLGYGINTLDGDMGEAKSVDVKNGLYWGIGVGTTIKENFIVELLYAVNYGEIEPKGAPFTIDTTYKAFRLKVGYKFAV